LCDWFGVTEIVCSKETVDLYNPKVVQATMGSIARVNVSYVDLNSLSSTDLPVLARLWKDIYKTTLPQEGVVVMGNEANGISKELEALIKNKLSIPRFGKSKKRKV
jgi:TrmH family RNA methyltransferase